MSVNPVLAAVVGLVVLDQHLAPTSWAAVMVIVGANTVARRSPSMVHSNRSLPRYFRASRSMRSCASSPSTKRATSPLI